MILYGRNSRSKVARGSYRNIVHNYLNNFLSVTSVDCQPNLDTILKVDANIGGKCNSLQSKVVNDKELELLLATDSDILKIRELCWAVEVVEYTLVQKTQIDKCKYFFFEDDIESKIASIIKSCIAKVTQNVIIADKAFREGNNIPGRYLNIIRYLDGKDITDKNVTDALYHKWELGRIGYTTAIRKEIHEVVFAQFGFTRSSHPELLEKYVLFGEATDKRMTSIHRRFTSSAGDIGQSYEKPQTKKDRWVFRCKVCGISPLASVRNTLDLCYYIIANNMDCFESYAQVGNLGVKKVYSKIRIDNKDFKECFKLLLCYILLTRFRDKIEASSITVIKNYLSSSSHSNSELALMLKSDISSLL